MSKKLTYGFVKNSFESEGYKLISKEYINSRTKLNYICPNNHQHSITWGAWKSGKRCPYCAGRPIITIYEVRKSFALEGYTLLSKEYINNHTKLKYICPKGHKHGITWHSWKQGQRCLYCAGLAKPTIEEVKSSFESEGYTLLSKTYTNAHTKLNYLCPNNHKHSIKWNDWRTGKRCPYCVGVIKPTIDFIRSSFEKEGYTLLSKKYINAHTKLNYICPEGHKHSITRNSWQQGVRCPTCFKINNFGPNHSRWKGGISFEPYCPVWTDQEFKSDIKARDNYTCQNPDCWGTDKKLCIHHIDYDKKNCNPNNLITVCTSCNSRANKDRDWHTSWYQAIMHNKQKMISAGK